MLLQKIQRGPNRCCIVSNGVAYAKIPVTPCGVTGIFNAQMGIVRPLRKHAGGGF